jgi:ABC-type branched-subunit amino acid transport system substrate-binding protein
MRLVKIIIILAVIGIGVWAGVGLYADLKKPIEEEAKTPLRIGVVLPLTGPSQSVGELSMQAIEMALESLTPEEREGIHVVYEDDALETKRTVVAVQKLIDVEKVDVLITYSSASSLAAAYMAEQKRMPLLAVSNDPKTNLAREWVLRIVPPAEDQATTIEEKLLRGKYKKIALVWNQSDGPKLVHDRLVELLNARGYEIVADESLAKTENEFRTVIAKVRAANPEVVFAGIFPQVGIFAKQVKDTGWDVPLVGFLNFESENAIKTAEGRLDGQPFAGYDNIAFLDQFHARYGTYPAPAGDHLYDAIVQLAKAKAAGKQTGMDILTHLKRDFTGAAGDYRYNGDGSFSVRLVPNVYENGKFMVIE